MKTIDCNIANKGEFLRNMYLVKEILTGDVDENIVADGMIIKGLLKDDIKTFIEKIDKVIPLVKRELPEWAVKLAEDTFDNRRGFIIWEKEKII